MKTGAVFLLSAFLLSGCISESAAQNPGLQLRTQLLQAESCAFRAEITADYGDSINSFTLDCEGGKDGNLVFSVAEPQSIAGITGNIRGGKGNLTFDEVSLGFPLLADNQLSPVSAPWIFLKTLRTGYMTSNGKDGDMLRLSLDDSFDKDALHVDIWLDSDNMPVRCEILHNGHKILSIDVKDFVIS